MILLTPDSIHLAHRVAYFSVRSILPYLSKR